MDMNNFKSLFNKKYPMTTKARKVWIGVVSIVIPAIILVILLNLAQSKTDQHKGTQKEDCPSVEMANTEDLNWYKNQGNKTLPQSNLPKPSAQNEFNNSTSSNPENDTEKARSAAIMTNQITTSNNIPSNSTAENTENSKNPDYLEETVQDPKSDYELQAGSIIPAVLITGINSDLPGQITGQVTENVYDSISGNHLLIPQGTKVVGLYDSKIAYGQERVLVAWKRLLFPDGKSLDLDGMPGVDLSGYAGFTDKTNNHYSKIFGSVVLMSLMGAGGQLSQPQSFNSNNNLAAPPTVNQILAQGLGANLASTGNALAQKNINIQPTLEVRPGYQFSISVTRDMVFTVNG